MNKDSDKLENFFKGTLQKIITICNLETYRYQIRYQQDISEDTGLSITVDSEYYRITIFYGDNALAEIELGNEDWLIYALCHEVAHIYTNDLYREAIGAQTSKSMKHLEKPGEQSTEKISRLIEMLFYQNESNTVMIDGYRKYNYNK